MKAIRILQTSFPAYSWGGKVLGKKHHILLTYTPEDVPVAEEEYQLKIHEIQEFMTLAFLTLEIAQKLSKAKKVQKKKPTKTK